MEWPMVPIERATIVVAANRKIPRKRFLSSGNFPVVSQEASYINGYWDQPEDVIRVNSPVVIFGDHTRVVKHVDFDFVAGADGVKVLKPNDGLDSMFLAYFLESEPISSLGYARHFRLLKKALIPIPAIHEQKRIVAILDQAFAAIDQARANTEQNLKNARELFKSYLQQVFSQRGEGWVEKSLGEAVVVERGSSPRPIKNFVTDDDSGVNWVKIGDAREGQKHINSTKERITRVGAEKSRFVGVGDFVLSNSMSFGRPYIMGVEGYIHDGWFALRLPSTIDADYFYYLLSSPYVKQQFQRLAAGAIVKNISGDLVKKALLPLPPLREQKVIAEGLALISEEARKVEELHRKKLAALDELKKSLLQKAFTGQLTQANQGEPA